MKKLFIANAIFLIITLPSTLFVTLVLVFSLANSIGLSLTFPRIDGMSSDISAGILVVSSYLSGIGGIVALGSSVIAFKKREALSRTSRKWFIFFGLMGVFLLAVFSLALQVTIRYA